jgi:SAM-dependent methyltransferase
VVDVGAGSGRLTVPLARLGHRVTAVEPAASMAEELRSAAAGLPVEIVEERWPEAAEGLGSFDVALSSHVVYDVADLAPFLSAMDAAAPTVVIECGADHPWSPLARLYRALHGLERPDGPTSEDLAEVVAEVVGSAPQTIRWQADRPLRFADRAELLAFYRRRLVVPPDRTAELEALLDIREADGWLVVGDGLRKTVTLWWGA